LTAPEVTTPAHAPTAAQTVPHQPSSKPSGLQSLVEAVIPPFQETTESEVEAEAELPAEAAPTATTERPPQTAAKAVTESVSNPEPEAAEPIVVPTPALQVDPAPFQQQVSVAPPPRSNASEIAAAIARPKLTPPPPPKPLSPRCPICDNTLAAPEQCGTCKAMIWPEDPMQYVLNHHLDRPAVTQWREALQAAPDSVANHLRLVLACCNLHDFAGARFHLNHAAMVDFNTSRFALESVDAFLRRPAVLVVDDSTEIRDVLVRLLCANDLLPIPVGDSWTASTIVGEQVPAAVLLDVAMPMMDGYEVCRQIRAIPELKSLPVIIVSGHDGLTNRIVAKMAGASDYISKPFKAEKVLSIVQRFVFKRQK
jgi:CheY-like chemotaxis protein